MNILQADRNKYEGFRENLQAKLRSCLPNDEAKIKREIEATHAVFKALENLDLIIRGIKQWIKFNTQLKA